MARRSSYLVILGTHVDEALAIARIARVRLRRKLAEARLAQARRRRRLGRAARDWRRRVDALLERATIRRDR